ncbi:uncharacterized protein LOC128895746 isoform X1 [Hylaeus anthracinus]|uniref:uncharacterized protein LOC128895746 isoform X1 n=1 Tax=Hylaeus anthracinus TaxID=313031 RepID=UPI0023B9E3EB|nr:uncharacterized protein LOC128895746 isoform X1 [Hylaeus anthracinus]
MAINIKFTKFDNTPWGFRLAGGSDFPQPLTVIRVTEDSLAECMGLKVGDVVVRLNDQPISSLTHGQAHEELMRAGNNFVLGVLREEDSLKAVEALSEENIVPYKIPLADLPPVFPESILKEEIVTEVTEVTTVYEEKLVEEEAKPEVEPLPDKPKDANSEVVPNQNLTDDEIAQLILEEEELLNDKGVLGVNFKKLRPRVTTLKQSKVIEELQNLATEPPPLVEQLKRTSVFLQKPQRPIPAPRKKPDEQEETEGEKYRVVIKKQQRRTITDRLLESGLLKPEDAKTPEPPTPEVNMDSNESLATVEEDDFSSLIVPSDAFDDDPCLQQQAQLESSVACTEVFTTRLEIEIDPSRYSLNVDAEASPPSDVVPLQSPKRKENVAVARRTPIKRRFKRFYTRAHYFRGCLFGKRDQVDTKKPSKVRPSFREPHQANDAPNLVIPAVLATEQPEEQPRRGSVEKSKSRMKGRYLETYLKREDNWIRRAIDGLLEGSVDATSSKLFDLLVSDKEVSLRRTRYAEKVLVKSVHFLVARVRSDILACLEREPKQKSRIRRRFYFKGRYFQRLLWRTVARLMEYIRGVSSAKDVRGASRRRSSAMIKMRGRYMEKCLLQNGFLDLRERFPSHPVVCSKRKLFVRTRYAERVAKKHLESLGFIVRYVREQVLQGISKSSSVDREAEGGLPDLIRSSKDFISTEVFHRGSRRISRSCRGSVSVGSPSLLNVFRNFVRDFDWLPTTFSRGSTDRTIGEKKAVQDGDREGRRLSFVPTVLYEGLTNRIGVDFTRLVAYAFVPCTSIVLLYMYK